ARAAFEEILALDPTHKQALKYINKIDKLALKKEYEEQLTQRRAEEEKAKEEKRLALQAETEKAQERKRAEEEAKLRQWEQEQRTQAEIALEKEQQRQCEEQIKIYLDEGSFYLKQRAFDRAKEKFNQVLSLDPDNKEAIKYLRQRDLTLAKQEREEFIAREKDQQRLQKIKLLYEKGDAYFQHGLYSEAISCFEEAVALEGKQ
ncbi:MAG: tetratricopeptide repeat protein, partial [Candidatus Omnitrophota bacterium]